jgi:hypothetical protein
VFFRFIFTMSLGFLLFRISSGPVFATSGECDFSKTQVDVSGTAGRIGMAAPKVETGARPITQALEVPETVATNNLRSTISSVRNRIGDLKGWAIKSGFEDAEELASFRRNWEATSQTIEKAATQQRRVADLTKKMDDAFSDAKIESFFPNATRQQKEAIRSRMRELLDKPGTNSSELMSELKKAAGLDVPDKVTAPSSKTFSDFLTSAKLDPAKFNPGTVLPPDVAAKWATHLEGALGEFKKQGLNMDYILKYGGNVSSGILSSRVKMYTDTLGKMSEALGGNLNVVQGNFFDFQKKVGSDKKFSSFVREKLAADPGYKRRNDAIEDFVAIMEKEGIDSPQKLSSFLGATRRTLNSETASATLRSFEETYNLARSLGQNADPARVGALDSFLRQNSAELLNTADVRRAAREEMQRLSTQAQDAEAFRRTLQQRAGVADPAEAERLLAELRSLEVRRGQLADQARAQWDSLRPVDRQLLEANDGITPPSR